MNAPLLFAEVEKRKNCDSTSSESGCLSILPDVSAGQDQVTEILTLVFGIFAAVSIVVIIIAGIRFVTSEGNPEKISGAKRAIIYALLGLVISLSAEIIVLFVLGRIG